MLWRPSPRISSLVGSSASRRRKSKPTPWVCRAPTTFPSRKAVPRSDQRLARELARTVGRDRDQRPPVLIRLSLAEIAVDAASGRVENLGRRGHAHGLDDAVSQVRPLVEVDRGLGRRTRDVGIRGQVNDEVVAVHTRDQRLGVLDIGDQ